jgi:hypothetical protein
MGERPKPTRPDGTEQARRAVAQATVGSFELFHLRFPRRHVTGSSIRPRLPRDRARGRCTRPSSGELDALQGSFMSIPAGAAHASRFGEGGCQVLVIRARDEEGQRLFGPLLRHRAHVSARAASLLGWQLAGELRCRDVSSPLALEGLTLELLARAGRAVVPGTGRPEPWVKTVRELLDARPSLDHPAGARSGGGPPPAQVARVPPCPRPERRGVRVRCDSSGRPSGRLDRRSAGAHRPRRGIRGPTTSRAASGATT